MKSIRSNFISCLFGGANYRKIEIRPEGIRIEGKKDASIVPYSQLQNLKLKSGPFFRTLHITRESDMKVALKGIPKLGTKSLDVLIHEEREQFLSTRSLLENTAPQVKDLAQWIDQRLTGEYWVANSDLPVLSTKLGALENILKVPSAFLTSDRELQLALNTLVHAKSSINSFRAGSNDSFVKEELDRYRTYFDTIESNPLTDSQRLAVITHEDNTRVIAGAGSGKTSVIVAKAGYLLNKGLCDPEQLLLIAFNKSAADEMRARIKKRIGIEVCATTFHALGLGIIGEATGRKPSLSKSAGDNRILIKDVRGILVDLLENRRTERAIKTYFQSFLFPYKSESDFESLGEYYNYLKKQDLRTLQGEKVKSFEEIEVANFLFLNGVMYEYEKQYEVDTADAEHSQYQPDFYLPEHNIYIEHFGINRDGSTAPYINREKYNEGIQWKRELHKKHNTVLIETYSYMKKEGNLGKELGKKLIKCGVTVIPIGSDAFLQTLKQGNILDPFSDLVATFLKHFKGNGRTLNQIANTAVKRKILDPRLKAFLGIFEEFLPAYENKLKDEKVIDFSDMIIQASGHAESKSYLSPYSCILVDEFQDISAGRARLVSALKKTEPHAPPILCGR